MDYYINIGLLILTSLFTIIITLVSYRFIIIAIINKKRINMLYAIYAYGEECIRRSLIPNVRLEHLEPVEKSFSRWFKIRYKDFMPDKQKFDIIKPYIKKKNSKY